MADVTQTTRFRFWRCLVRFIGVIVPRRFRTRFRQEWEAELEYREEMLARWDRLDWRNKFELLWRSLGAFRDALWLQQLRWEDEMIQDLRFGMRMLLKHKGFTIVAVVTLALGIGANTAVFTLINALLFRELPVTNPQELVIINANRGRSGAQGGNTYSPRISFPMYRDMRARQGVLTDILASGARRPTRLTITDTAGTVDVDNVQTSLVTANYWSVLGVAPALGRFFTEDEDRNPNSSETAGSLVVLSYSFWERQFGRDPGVLRHTVIVDRSPCRVIGVAARGFSGEQVGSEPDIWVPLISFSSANVFENRGSVFTHEVGRLKPGVSLAQAQASMTLLYQQLVQEERAQAPRQNQDRAPAILDFSIQLDPAATGISFGFPQGVRQTYKKPLWIIMAIVALVLLIACANVANLLLARAVARQREISVRLALGCGRFRLLRQLLTESLLLAALGTAAGLLVAWWGSRILLRMVDTGYFPLQLDLSPDWRVLLFTVAVLALTGIGFGLAPAWRASSFEIASAMKDQARGTGQRVKQYLGRTLVIIQVSLSLLLLIGAGLLIRSLHNLRQIDLGFRPENVLVFDLAHNPRNREPEALARVARDVRERVRQIPGVESASLSMHMLMSSFSSHSSIGIKDRTPEQGERVEVRLNSVSPDYFETVGMTLIAGRGFEDRDAMNAPQVAVVNETLARRYFPGGNAVGRIVEGNPGQPIEIVGVVREAKYSNLYEEAPSMVYRPLWQSYTGLYVLEVRTTEPLSAMAGPVRRALLEVTRDVMIRRALPLTAQVDSTLASERLLTTLGSFFGALALLLASVGLYGVLSYAVAQRRQEIGIRMALGATVQDVLWLVLRQSLNVVLIGIISGIALALVCTRLISSFLYGLSPTDPIAIALAMLILMLVALLASYLPARRATKVDPIVALRHD